MRRNRGTEAAMSAIALGTLAGCVYPPPLLPPPPPRVVYRAPPPPPPPPLLVEQVPPPPAAYLVWRPGHWRWIGFRYAWVPGHYVRRIA